MTRTITTAAELDALPVGSVVRNLSRGITAERLADGRGVIPGNPAACPWDSLWSAGSHIVVLYDPSAPAPAPSVVPEGAVPNDAAVAAVAIRLYLADRDPKARGAWSTMGDGQKSPYRMFAYDLLAAALPLLTAAPSATRDEVARALCPDVWRIRDDGPFPAGSPPAEAVVRGSRETADALLARFAVTPKEDR